MYAVVNIAGQQFRVAKSEKIVAPRLTGEEGSQVEFDQVLMLGEGNSVKIGQPFVAGAQVRATIVKHDKADTVTIFKKKRRKGYRVKNGHRQAQTRLQIEEIIA
jgi:large subunit ribosomal protein L21